MPLTLEAGILFSVLIAPGFLLLRGYARRRTRAAPERDLYALAQAVVGSLFLLAALWVGLSVLGKHELLRDLRGGELEGHETTAFWLLVGLLLAPYPLGWAAAELVDWIGRRPTRFPGKIFRWSGLFDPPTAWDAAWLKAREHQWALVAIEYHDGTDVLGLLASHSKVDLSPQPNRQVFFQHEYRYVNGQPQKVAGHGIWVRADDVAFIRIRAVGPRVS